MKLVKLRWCLVFVILLMMISYDASAGVCDVAWDGNKVVAAISGRPASFNVPLRYKEQQVAEVSVSQILAFSDAKDRIARVAGSSPNFVICSSSDPNAFAASGDGGDIVGVTIGMMKVVDGDRDMAAAVIGHEFAHHTHGHAEAGAARDTLLDLAGLIIGMAVDARSQRRNGIPSTVGQTVGQIGAMLVSRKFDRDQEREADATGFQYLLSAGFNPLGAVRLSFRMRQLGSDGAGLFFDSHPGWVERTELFQTMIATNLEARHLVEQKSKPSVVANSQSLQAPPPSVRSSALLATFAATDAQKSYEAAQVAWRIRDFAEAVRNLRDSASAGYARAQNVLGFLYVTGNGVVKDPVEAVRLFRLSADQGDAAGQSNLGRAYAIGVGGLIRDEVEAVRLFRLSADQGDSQGQTNLAFAYLEGRGTPRNDEEALRLFQIASSRNNPGAQAGLGIMNIAGRGGLVRDEAEALKLFRIAANRGNAVGQFALGSMYANGNGGLTKDDAEAVKWFRLAASQGHEAANKQLARRGVQ